MHDSRSAAIAAVGIPRRTLRANACLKPGNDYPLAVVDLES